MPQEFHVLKCYSCNTFQVQIVKKINKFECKMCGEKQSVKKEYGKGSGKDCRLHVQKLNELRIQNNFKLKENVEFYEKDVNINENANKTLVNKQSLAISKWSEYLSKEDEQEEIIDPEFSKFTFEKPNKKKRTNKSTSKQNINNELICKQSTDCTYLNDEAKINMFVENNIPLLKTQQESSLNKSTTSAVSFILQSAGTSKEKVSKWNIYDEREYSKTSNGKKTVNNDINSENKIDIFQTNYNNLDDILDF